MNRVGISFGKSTDAPWCRATLRTDSMCSALWKRAAVCEIGSPVHDRSSQREPSHHTGMMVTRAAWGGASSTRSLRPLCHSARRTARGWKPSGSGDLSRPTRPRSCRRAAAAASSKAAGRASPSDTGGASQPAAARLAQRQWLQSCACAYARMSGVQPLSPFAFPPLPPVFRLLYGLSYHSSPLVLGGVG